MLHDPQRTNNPNFVRNNYQQQTPFRFQQNNLNNQRPFPKPEPMEVDNSINSRQVNYKNRQQTQKNYKRPPSQQIQNQNKTQRVFHTEQNNQNKEIQEYNEEIKNYDENFNQTLIDYIKQENQPDCEKFHYLDDVHFLE